MNNGPIADFLERIAWLMELKGENPFKVRSFKNAASLVRALDQEVAALLETGALRGVKGIGPGIGGNIAEFLARGGSDLLDTLERELPEGLLEMADIRGLGPARVRRLHQELGITSLGELEYACTENRLVELKGFGPMTQSMILEELEAHKRYAGLFLLHRALAAVEEWVDFFRGLDGVDDVSVTGPARRYREVLPGGAVVVAADGGGKILEAFSRCPSMGKVLRKGKDTLEGVHVSGVPIAVQVVPKERFVATLFQSTGSEEHLDRLSRKSLDLKGFFPDEAAVYARLGLPFIPPELREGDGEVEAAEAGNLPCLVAADDFKGVMHVHTDYSDGTQTIEEMAKAARDRGYQYLGIADHSRSAGYAGGLSVERLKKQGKEVKALNKTLNGFTVLHGVESDILKDGSLDYPDEVLASLDFVIASVHSGFRMDRAAMTARIIKAVENPYTRILGHPTGRLLLGREPYDVDLEAVVEACAQRGVMMELNANPQRLDMDWRWLRHTASKGVMIAVNPDAHRPEGLDDVRYGICMARKGWLEPKHVANCLDAAELLSLWSA